MGVPVRKAPDVLVELTGVSLTKAPLRKTRCCGWKARWARPTKNCAKKVSTASVAYTDDTGWRIAGKPAQLMGSDTDHVTVYQIRNQH